MIYIYRERERTHNSSPSMSWFENFYSKFSPIRGAFSRPVRSATETDSYETQFDYKILYIMRIVVGRVARRRRLQSSGAVCESGGGRPGLPVPNSPYGLSGRKVVVVAAVVEEEIMCSVKRLWERGRLRPV